MERYDYLEALVEDVQSHYDENISMYEDMDSEELMEALNDNCWIDDSVTGNASGSYYCNCWKAEEALCHNWDLVVEACSEFGYQLTDESSAETMDVIVRCYLLNQAVAIVVDDIMEE